MKTNNNILPKGWEVKEFAQFAEVSKAKYNPISTEDLKCIELEHLNQETGNINGWVNSSEQKSTKNKFQKGQVLFGKLRPYLKKYWLAEFDGVCSSEIWVLNSVSKKCTNEFLFRLVQSEKFIQVANVSSGSKMPRADWDYVSEFPFSLPPLPEQTAIAALLSTWDTAIQKIATLIAQKQLQKKWLMQKLLSGKKKNENHMLGNYIKEVSVRNTGNKITRVLSVTNSRGFIDQEEQFDRVVASKEQGNYKVVKKGQFAYNPSRVNVGSLDLLRKFDEGILSPMYVVFEPDTEKINIEYLFYLLKTTLFTARIPMFVQGSVRDTLSFDGLCGMKFFIPSISEQTKIAQILQTADKEIQLLKSKSEKLKEQKKGLMQQLLTGKKRLT
ncbi:restriction endonuclease subunit S [Fluviicola sp.]|jgi:type I restriction enzyme S subunit|uniref:restriction endonuclease subunit S n=1 Tax=Fluviicola sp. TaxID=1917219 RepID=UPI0028289F8B|nr:restriction endonuclease subunit S [Fluviicola sp.]MDR0802759.1 restriction endonuclease subunit S [Fluviicola sp.]